jgi:hypothetical protein
MQKAVSIKRATGTVIILCLLPFYCFTQSNRIVINNSKSDYHIVVSQNLKPTEKEAADTLQKYLLAISGCKLPITHETKNTNAKQLIIGGDGILKASEAKELNEDGVIIKSINSSIVFGGGNRKGVLYSVYTFLDSLLNCKMYAYDVVEIPKRQTVVLPADINIIQTPAFDYRMSGFINLTKAYCDFNKQNYLYENWGLWVHSFEVLVPAKTYFAIHPEYFSLVNGRRTPDQLCLSNTDVLNIVVTNLRNRIKENPNAKYWSVSQNDNQSYCQCDKCKRLDKEQGSHQASILNFVNQVAKSFPDKIISTLAYLYSEKPPKSLRPAINVMIMLCDINGDRSKPIIVGADNNFDKNLRGWQTLTNNIFVWEYVVQFSHSMSPFPNLYIIQPNIQYFKERKIHYLYEEGFVNQPSEFSELRTYLISKLMWDANSDAKALMHNFIRAFYGEGSAPFIESYINQLYNNSKKNNTKLYIFGNPADQRNTYLTKEDILNYKTIFQKALNTKSINSTYYKRIVKEYLPILYSELDIDQARMTENKSNNGVDKAKFKQSLDEFYKLAKSGNINYLNEGRKSIDEYYKSMTKLLQ